MKTNFTIGTKIKIINAGNGAYGANGEIGKVTIKESNAGLLKAENGFNVEISPNKIWRVSHHGTYEMLEEPKLRFLDITVNIKGDKTKAIIEDADNNLYRGVAKRNPKDDNDNKIGVLISVARALNLDENKEQKLIDALFDKEEKRLSDFSFDELLSEIENRMFIRK